MTALGHVPEAPDTAGAPALDHEDLREQVDDASVDQLQHVVGFGR